MQPTIETLEPLKSEMSTNRYHTDVLFNLNQHLACIVSVCVCGVGAKPGDFNKFNIKIHSNQSGTNIVALIADVFVAWKIVLRPALEAAEQMHERKKKNC